MRARFAARLGHRGVPALLHAGPGRRPNVQQRLCDRGHQLSRRAIDSGCPGRWPTGTRACSPTRTPSTWGARATGTAASARHPPLHRLQHGRMTFSECSFTCWTGCRTSCATRPAPRITNDRRHQRDEAPAGDVHAGTTRRGRLDETLDALQRACDEQQLAEPVTQRPTRRRSSTRTAVHRVSSSAPDGVRPPLLTTATSQLAT